MIHAGKPAGTARAAASGSTRRSTGALATLSLENRLTRCITIPHFKHPSIALREASPQAYANKVAAGTHKLPGQDTLASYEHSMALSLTKSMSLLQLYGVAPPFGLMHNCLTKAKRKYGAGIAVVAGHGTTRTPLSPAGRLATLLPHQTVGALRGRYCGLWDRHTCDHPDPVARGRGHAHQDQPQARTMALPKGRNAPRRTF